jgi:hypothetical protein
MTRTCLGPKLSSMRFGYSYFIGHEVFNLWFVKHWYVSNVSIIFYAPCLFYTICFMFCLHFVVFFVISGTNLLTRCHSVNSLFSAVFVFQKSYIGNILRIGRNKDQNSYFTRRKDEDQMGAKGGPEGTLTMGWRAPQYVSNVSIIFDTPCLFLHHLLSVLLHFVAFLCIF